MEEQEMKIEEYNPTVEMAKKWEGKEQIPGLCGAVVDQALTITKQNIELIKKLKDYFDRALSPGTPKAFGPNLFIDLTLKIASYALMCSGPSATLVDAIDVMPKHT